MNFIARNPPVTSAPTAKTPKYMEFKWLRVLRRSLILTSILLSDISVEGDLVEKDRIIVDAKISGDIKAQVIETHSNSNIKGNIKSKVAQLGGKVKGNINSDKIDIKKTANIDGVLNQKVLSIEEGATLKIKTETYK